VARRLLASISRAAENWDGMENSARRRHARVRDDEADDANDDANNSTFNKPGLRAMTRGR